MLLARDCVVYLGWGGVGCGCIVWVCDCVWGGGESKGFVWEKVKVERRGEEAMESDAVRFV